MKRTIRRRYSRATIVCARIVKHLMTTVPMIVGFLLVFGSADACELCHISALQCWIQSILGLVLLGSGGAMLYWFEN